MWKHQRRVDRAEGVCVFESVYVFACVCACVFGL